MRHPPKFDPSILAGVLSAFVTGSACAHESRIVPALLKGGKVESPPQSRVRLSVGFTQEPTLEDQWNSIDLILFSYKDSCQNLGADAPNDFVGNPIDPTLRRRAAVRAMRSI
jgi:hypothetical protein